MKYAFVSTQEKIYSYDNTLLGARVCQVQDNRDGLIDVDGVLFWVECPDSMTAENSYYDLNSEEVKLVPTKPE